MTISHRVKRVLLGKCIPALVAAAVLGLPTTASARGHTYIGGPSAPGEADAFRYERPRSLVLQPPGVMASNAEILVLRRVRWAGWGQREATATARTRFKTYDPWTRVRVRAYRVRTCHAIPSFRLYTRVRTTTPYGSHTWRAPSCSLIEGFMD
jgi:hypothetical protein